MNIPAIHHHKDLVSIVYEVNRQMFGLCRIIGHEGGTRSGKTYNTVEFLIDKALESPAIEITIASRTMRHLKKGAMKDFIKAMRKRKIWNENNWNATDFIYTFRNKAYIEFLEADDVGKVSGPGRDILFCNEANFIKKNVFDQLLRRTRICCILDYNPIHPKHWLYDKVLNRKDAYLWRSTYKDNLHFLPPEQVLEIELMKENDPLAWQIYGLGLRGQYQKGQIFGQHPNKPWTAISHSDYEKIDAKEICGLDWGFYPDPNACLGVKKVGKQRFIRKYNYAQKQADEDMFKTLRACGLTSKTLFVADNSDVKAIAKMRMKFPLTYVAVKGQNSVDRGIKAIQPLDVYYVMDPDLEFEYYNYTYILGPDEEPTGVPTDKYNHLMDCFRYVEQYREYL